MCDQQVANVISRKAASPPRTNVSIVSLGGYNVHHHGYLDMSLP